MRKASFGAPAGLKDLFKMNLAPTHGPHAQASVACTFFGSFATTRS
jgi:hypothetical protein